MAWVPTKRVLVEKVAEAVLGPDGARGGGADRVEAIEEVDLTVGDGVVAGDGGDERDGGVGGGDGGGEGEGCGGEIGGDDVGDGTGEGGGVVLVAEVLDGEGMAGRSRGKTGLP